MFAATILCRVDQANDRYRLMSMSLLFNAPLARNQVAKQFRVGRTLVYGHRMPHGPPHGALMYWHQSTMARPSQMAIRSSQHR
jgi:hypothetical protein